MYNYRLLFVKIIDLASTRAQNRTCGDDLCETFDAHAPAWTLVRGSHPLWDMHRSGALQYVVMASSFTQLGLVMRGKLRRIVGSLIGAAALSVTGIVPATAASSSGAEVYKTSSCQISYLLEAEICFDGVTEVSSVETRSGHTIYQTNGKYEFTIGEPYNESVEGSYHNQFIFLKGEPHVMHYRESKVVVLDGGETCNLTFNLHYANGEVKYEDWSFVCE